MRLRRYEIQVRHINSELTDDPIMRLPTATWLLPPGLTRVQELIIARQRAVIKRQLGAATMVKDEEYVMLVFSVNKDVRQVRRSLFVYLGGNMLRMLSS